ncbi:MAG: hypothetical protein ACOH5I_04885 [Oligoflexus sp.]
MAQVVFAVDLDEETIQNLQELRWRRRLVLLAQINEMEGTLQSLEQMGALTGEEKLAYEPQVRGELEAKLQQIESRLADSSVFYDDEIEFYLELIRFHA